MMAFIWVQMLGFLFLTRWAVGEHDFRSPIEVVLLEKQYRPFLQMSAQGASIVLGFFLVNAVYVLYTGAETSDYIGVAITLLLLIVGFVPPWMQLTAKVDRAVKAEMAMLRRRLASSEAARAAHPTAGRRSTAQGVEDHLDEALVMLRISYLERLHCDLGQRGGQEHRAQGARARHHRGLLRVQLPQGLRRQARRAGKQRGMRSRLIGRKVELGKNAVGAIVQRACRQPSSK